MGVTRISSAHTHKQKPHERASKATSDSAERPKRPIFLRKDGKMLSHDGCVLSPP